MAGNPYEAVYIVGAGQTAYEKRSSKPAFRVLWEALVSGLRSAGLPFRSVQGLALTSFVLPPDNVTTVAEHFGIEARFLFHGVYGGASGIIGMLHAARAIHDGDADVIAVLTGDVFDVAAHNEMLDRFNGSMRDWGWRRTASLGPTAPSLSHQAVHGTSTVLRWRISASCRCSAVQCDRESQCAAAHANVHAGLPDCTAHRRSAAAVRPSSCLAVAETALSWRASVSHAAWACRRCGSWAAARSQLPGKRRLLVARRVGGHRTAHVRAGRYRAARPGFCAAL